MKIKIIGIGSYIPNKEVSNTDFGDHVFLNEDGTPFAYPNEVVIKKFKGVPSSFKNTWSPKSVLLTSLFGI